MDTLLILVTVLSLAMAAGMSLVVLKLLREERLRSDARVAALLDGASTHHTSEGPAASGAVRRRPAPAEALRPAAPGREAPRKGAPYHGSPAPRRVAREHSGDLPLRTGQRTADLFVEPPRQASWGPRIALAAGAIALLLGAGFTVWSPARPLAGGTAAAGAAALELLTLRHVAEAGSLTVSGVVQNPKDGLPRRWTIATASALAADGSIVASGQAPIDVTTFGPGEESPFIVRIPVAGPAGTVARYRIGFRADDGSVIAHVDRRTAPEAVAQK